MHDETTVTQVLKDYYSAFSTLNLEAILPYFHQPALIMGPTGVVAVPTHSMLSAILTQTLESLKARDYGRSEYKLEQVKQLSATAASAGGVAIRYKLDGQELERVGITYLLHKAETWKIAVMVLQGL